MFFTDVILVLLCTGSHLTKPRAKVLFFYSKQTYCMKDLKTLNRFFYKYRGRVVLGVLFVLLANYFGLVPARITREALDYITEHTSAAVLPALRSVDRIEVISMYALTILGVVLLRGVFMFFMRQTIIVMSRHVEYDMKNEIFDQYQRLDMNFYARSNTGDLMNRISEDVSRVRMYTGPALMYIVNIALMLIMVFVAMIRINVPLTLLVLSPLPVLVIMVYYVQNMINRKSEQVQETLSDLSTNVQETFSGVRIIKSFASENVFSNLFVKRAKDYYSKSMDLARIHALFYPAILLLVGLSSVGIIYYGGILVNEHKITYGNVAEFVIYLNMLMWPVGSLGWTITLIQRADASQRRINEFLDLKPEITNRQKVTSESLSLPISFKNVNYQYPEKDVFALHNINLTIHPGETIAIIGTTGSGKTTLANLLVRIHDATSGTVTIGDNNICDVDLQWLRQRIGFITQDVLLFSDSIANNISFGLPEESSADLRSRVEDAARKAYVYDEVMRFKDGFETLLGERGISLSGGQKQRVSIARALIKDPDILILDDCLSAVDTYTEEVIMKNLESFLEKRTAIILGHRISSVKYADRILVLDKGTIVEEGTHNDLIQLGGFYSRIHETQLTKEKTVN